MPGERKKWAHKRFIEVGTAYEVLSAPDTREEYDDFLAGKRKGFRKPVMTEEDVEERLMRRISGLPGFVDSFEDWEDFKYKMKRAVGIDLDNILSDYRERESKKETKRANRLDYFRR